MTRDFTKRFTSTSDPTANEDRDTGYAIGDEWVNTLSDVTFLCTDNTSSAAVWRCTNNYKFTPTQYRDTNISGFMLAGPAANLPDEVQFKDSGGSDTGIYTYGFDVGESAHGALELQHDYAEGTDLSFHFHWQGVTAPAGGSDNFQMQLIYTFGIADSVLASATTITVEDAVTTQYAFGYTYFAAISGSGRKIGDQLLFKFSRIAASSDEYAGDILLATIGIHYQVNSMGSAQISTK